MDKLTDDQVLAEQEASKVAGRRVVYAAIGWAVVLGLVYLLSKQ